MHTKVRLLDDSLGVYLMRKYCSERRRAMQRKLSLIVRLLILLQLGWQPCLLAQPNLQYGPRGNRYEGVRPKPIAGYDIDLISARVNYHEKGYRLPELLKVKFYLERPSEVHLTVRELDYKYYYWMDKVKPANPWRSGFKNVFEWPTDEVLKRLDHIGMYDLGVVARVGKSQPSKLERVAPVILYHSKHPSAIGGYLFTFKANGDIRITCSFYKEQDIEPLSTKVFRRLLGGRPFTVRWDSSGATEGWYRLLVSGYFLNTNDPVDQAVYFYHKPTTE
jgi:hypothetical protein